MLDVNQEASGQFEQNENQPVCFFGALFPEDDTGSRQRLSNTASRADENSTIPVIFRHEDTDLPTLPESSIVIEFNPNEELRLEKEAGPHLLDIRRAEEHDLRERFFKLVKKEVEETPGNLLRNLVYFAIFSAAGVYEPIEEAVAGESESESISRQQKKEKRDTKGERDTSIEPSVATGGWQMYRCNATRTGYISDETGPVENPTQRWTFETGGSVTSSPAVANGTVYIGSTDSNVYALDATTGHQRWAFDTGREVFSSPAVANGTVYIGSKDSNVYALDATTGRQRWAFETGKGVTSSPAVANGTVYIGSKDHNVYALTE